MNKFRPIFASVLLCVLLVLVVPYRALAQAWSPAAADKRCPSQWGAADERGAANHMKPETVMTAARLIREGRMYELGRVLEAGIPQFGARKFSLYTLRSSGPFGDNQLRGNEEIVTTELGQMGTQLDGLPHVGIGDSLYNCVKIDEAATRGGFTRLGIEKVGALFTRGVLVDVAGAKGKDMLEAGYEITAADLQEALSRSGQTLAPGVAVLIRTGWGRLWMKDNVRFNAGEPGIGIGAAEWLASMNPMLVGSDNWGIEVLPNPDKRLASPVHQIMVAINGIFLIENLDLEDLARDRVSEFAFVVQPLKMKGGSGSSVAPIAVK